MEFSGKNILIVGGSSGIGLALVKDVSAKGANVFVVSRTVSDEWPTSVNYQVGDVLEDLTALKTFLPAQLHGLVYAVGNINLKPFSRFTAQDFLKDYQLNVVGAAMVVQQALPALKAAGNASVVFLSTVASKIGMSYHASTAAAKSGVEGLSLSLAAEFAPQHIRFNVIAPSLTDTPLAQNLLNTPEKREASAKRHPLGSVGKADEIAAAISFLLSENSNWMTAQVIGMDGGMGSVKMM
jgi:3-oxoacyl-[acyl-carrier protein] reductase